jgi:photosystem II stability/assembly factor-like uncharacterized protein
MPYVPILTRTILVFVWMTIHGGAWSQAEGASHAESCSLPQSSCDLGNEGPQTTQEGTVVKSVVTEVRFPSRFKRVPTEREPAPAWALRMYSGDPDFWGIVDAREAAMKGQPYVKDIHERNFKHWLIHVEHLVNEEGRIEPVDEWALRQWERHRETQGTPSLGRSMPMDTEAVWHPKGPMETYNKESEGGIPVSWQCNVYCFDQSVSNPDICVAGVEAGDLFKSTDRGLSWQAVTEGVPGIRTVRAVKIAPSDPTRIYFEANQWLYASEDGGSTWAMLHNLGEHATQIAVHPTDPDMVLVSAWNGLHRSEDGGVTWNTVFSGTTWDVAFHPSQPQVVYALRYGQALNRCEMHRSDDGGQTFVLKDEGFFVPSDPTNASADGGRLGVTPADEDRVYVALIGRGKAEDTGWIGLYQSLDRGDSWANLNGQDGAPYDPVDHPSVANGNLNGTGIYQGFYDFDLAVSHNDPDKAWVGVTALSATYDGGATWQRIGAYSASTYDIGWIHPDIQDLSVVGDDIWVATDGGLNFSQDELATHESRKRGIYNSTFWGFGQGWNQDLQVGGRYHNGNMAYVSTYDLGHTMRLGGAEAPTGYVHPLNGNGLSSHFSDITDVVVPSTLVGPTLSQANLSMYPNESYVDFRNSELVVHPVYGDHMVLGSGGSLYRTTDGGNQWEVWMDWGGAWSVYEIEQGMSDPNRWYVVARSGSSCKLFRTTNNGQTWGQLTSGLPANWGSMEIALNPGNINDIWAMQAGGSGLYRSTTGGTSWESMSESMWAGESLREILPLGETGVVVLSDQGVYAYKNETQEWLDMSAGIPATWAPLEGAVHYATGTIRIADKGKGIWEAEVPWPIPPVSQPMTASPQVYCALDTVVFDCHGLVNHQGASWSWSFEPEPLFVSDASSRRVEVVFGEGGDVDVTLAVTLADGTTDVHQQPSMVHVGDPSQCAPDGLAGGALRCAGSPQFGLTHDLGVVTNTYTVAAWVKPNGIQPDYTGLVLGGIDQAAGLNVRGGNELGYHWPGGAWWWSSGLVLPSNEWSHVALVVSPTQIKVMLNGIEAVHNTSPELVAMGSQWVGSYRGWTSRNFHGWIDEVKIWNRALTLQEVRDQRHLNLTPEDAESDPELLGYYQFNEDASFMVNKKPGSVHGAYSGGATTEPSSAPVGWGSMTPFNAPLSGFITHDLGSWNVTSTTSADAIAEVRIHRLDPEPFEAPEGALVEGGHWVVNAYASESVPSTLDAVWTGEWTLSSANEVWDELNVLAGMTLYHRSVHGEGEWTASCGLEQGVNLMGSVSEVCVWPLEGQWMLVSDACGVDTTEVLLCPGESLVWNDQTIQSSGAYYHLNEPLDGCSWVDVLVADFPLLPSLEWTSQPADGGTELVVSDEWQVVAWTVNGALIPEATENSWVASVDGAYGVTAIHVGSGCVLSYEALLGCPGDFNGDATVGVADVLAYLSSFGCITNCGVADLNGDGAANTSDLLMLLALFGTICS